MSQMARTVIGGRYELEHVVGRGGYGVVFRALDRRTGQPVAVKVLSGGALADPQRVERMVREQQAMVALTGTSAVAAVDLCRGDGGALCLVMEWLEGVDLEQRLAGLEQRGQRMDMEELFRILAPVVDTLERAHEMGLVHRDIKPANIFLVASPPGGVRLLDFGLSRMKSSATLTAAGTIMGSPSYIPPETWRGDSRLIDHRADLYSLGVITFRALSGRLPFATTSLPELFGLVTTAPRPSLCAVRPDLPPGVDVWIRHALAISPDERFDSARDWYECLTAAIQGVALPPVATRSEPPRRLEAEAKNVLAAAWRAASSILSRVADQLHLPAGAAGLQGSAQPDTTAGAPSFEPQIGPLAIGWPAADSPAADDQGDRPSLVTQMLAATEPRPGSSPEPGSDEDMAGWLGVPEAKPSPARRGPSPTLIRFREHLASALAEAEPDDEPAPADVQVEEPEAVAEPPAPPPEPEAAAEPPAPPAEPQARAAKRTRPRRPKKAKAKKKPAKAKKKVTKAKKKVTKATRKPARAAAKGKKTKKPATRKTARTARGRAKKARKR